MKTEITLEQVDELMEMLTGGDLPEGMSIREQPRLNRKEAFSVIWFLQEQTRVLPDNIEMCGVCEELYDTEYGGYTVDSDEAPDEWHTEHGVTAAMLKENDGAIFCSAECECEYWYSLQEKGEK